MLCRMGGVGTWVLLLQGGSNMTGTDAACLHTNQSRSYLNHLVYAILGLSSWIYAVTIYRVRQRMWRFGNGVFLFLA